MKHLPNIITCLNLFVGAIAIPYAYAGAYEAVFYLIILAALFDFLDGFVARTLKAFSPIGKELDSLADMISFGLLPGVVVYSFLMQYQPVLHAVLPECLVGGIRYLPYLGYLIPIFSALRLANFNIDTRQSEHFIGMPTPANTLFWVSLIYFLNEQMMFAPNSIWAILIVVPLIFCFSWLMVSEQRFIALKFKSFRFTQANVIRYLAVLVSIICFLFWGIGGIYMGITIYLIGSFAYFHYSAPKN